MDNEFEVEVPITCDRTGRVSKLTMSIDTATAYKQDVIEKEISASEIISFLRGVPTPKPDLVVMFRGVVVALPTVVDKKDDVAVMRLLHNLTQSEDFPKPVSKPRKTVENGGIRESSPPHDATVSPVPATAE